MPFAFKLPTTSSLSFQESVSCESHPSLPSACSTFRGVVRNTLKHHKRLPLHAQPTHLSSVLASLEKYIAHLLTLDAGLSDASDDGRRALPPEGSAGVVRASLTGTLAASWRIYLSRSAPGREAPRVQISNFRDELLFTLLTLGETYYLLARAQLHSLHDATTPSVEKRTGAISAAMKHYLDAHAVFSYAHARASSDAGASSTPAVDINASTLGALAALSLAEATLIAVLKDDPYPAVVAQQRNKNDKDWMIMAPSLPKVRAHLFARLCLASADHAGQGLAMVASPAVAGKVHERLVRYMEDSKRLGRAKACRFFGIDAEVGGSTGEGVAWLNGARKELGFAEVGDDDGKTSSGFSRLKKEWTEKREDKKVEKSADWGGDAGRFEEGRVVDMLDAKWKKMNDTVNVQIVPSSDALVSKMPSGREYHSPKPWVPPSLDALTLAQMKAPTSFVEDGPRPMADDSSEDELEIGSADGLHASTQDSSRASTSAYY